MTRLLHHLRPLLVGLVALLLTAGIAFAAKPAPTGAGTETGTQASGQQVPSARDGTEPAEVEADTETDSDSADHCSVDLTSQAAIDAAPNHGSVVCSAAHQKDFPDTFKNHGAWVSSFAHQNHGTDASATGTLKSADGKAKAAEKSQGHSQSGTSTQD
ncbi:MAG: hypothetical protein ABIQ17_04270 [Candidatus Limnocylindrales bacterium]